jgi:hypothetical protein
MSPEPDLVFPPFRLDLAQHQLWRGTERVPSALRPLPYCVILWPTPHV